MAKKYYEIGGVKFWQGPMVPAQEEAVGEVLSLLLSCQGRPSGELIEKLILQKGFLKALTWLLVREGDTLKDRDYEADLEHLRYNLDTDQQVEVIEDFFECNAKARMKLSGFLAFVPLPGPIPPDPGNILSER